MYPTTVENQSFYVQIVMPLLPWVCLLVLALTLAAIGLLIAFILVRAGKRSRLLKPESETDFWTGERRTPQRGFEVVLPDETEKEDKNGGK